MPHDYDVWSSLRSFAAKKPRVVTEHEVLRIAASLVRPEPTNAVDIVRRQVLTWAETKVGGRLPKGAWEGLPFDHVSGGRNCSAVRIDTGDSDIWAVRIENPDTTIAGRTWTNEIVVGCAIGQSPRMSLRQLVSTAEGELDVEPHTPGFVQQILAKCGMMKARGEVITSPWTVASDSDAESLIELSTNPNRLLPLCVLSVADDAKDQERPFLNAVALGKAILGNGHVAVIPAEYTWLLSERLGRARSVFGGAVRVYLPGFAEDANPYSHPLILPEQLNSPDKRASAIKSIRVLAARESLRRTRLGTDVLSFMSLRSASLEIFQRKLAETGASETEQLSAALRRNTSLEKQIDEQKVEMSFYASEHDAALIRAESAEDQLRASAYRIQQLLEQIKSRGEAVDSNIELPRSWEEFANWCDTNLAGRVSLSPVARRNLKAPEYEDLTTAAKCLLWLANDCRDRRVNGGGSVGEEPIMDGVRNAHCGGDQFQFSWQGKNLVADWHIKCGGNTRDPSRCLRIYYGWDDEGQQIVVADMPGHRRTNAT